MRNRRIFGLIAVAAVALLALGATWLWRRSGTDQFVTVPVTKSDLVRSIAATGAVNPVTTVQVGTYVSGPIQTLSCDFNTRVVAGQRRAQSEPPPHHIPPHPARAN